MVTIAPKKRTRKHTIKRQDLRAKTLGHQNNYDTGKTTSTNLKKWSSTKLQNTADDVASMTWKIYNLSTIRTNASMKKCHDPNYKNTNNLLHYLG